MSFRSRALIRSAEGQPCAICGDDRTTVSAHINSVAHGKGKGIKAPDYFTAHLCQQHHDMVDGRRHLEGPYTSPIELWTWAYLRTVERWFQQGIVEVK